MQRYLMVKNGLLTFVVASIYYKSIFTEEHILIRILATIVVAVSLMGLLKEVDKLYMEKMEE